MIRCRAIESLKQGLHLMILSFHSRAVSGHFKGGGLSLPCWCIALLIRLQVIQWFLFALIEYHTLIKGGFTLWLLLLPWNLNWNTGQLNKFGWGTVAFEIVSQKFPLKAAACNISKKHAARNISKLWGNFNLVTNSILHTAQPSLENLPIHVMKMVKMCNGFCYRNGEST